MTQENVHLLYLFVDLSFIENQHISISVPPLMTFTSHWKRHCLHTNYIWIFFMNISLIFNLLSSFHDAYNLKMKRRFNVCQSFHIAGPSGRAGLGVHLRSLACWDCGFESHRGAWMFVCCECCVLSGRGLCDELITRPEESYWLWCVVVCDLET